MAHFYRPNLGGSSDCPPASKALSTPLTPPRLSLIHPGIAQAIYDVLVELDASPHALVNEVGLDPGLFDGSNILVSYAALGQLIALGAERTGCRHLSLLVGQRADLASLGPIGALMRVSDTIGSALRAFEEHVGMQNWGAAIGLGAYDGVAVLSYSPYEPGAEGAAHHSERALATMFNVLRALCGPDWALLEVLLPRFVPPDTRPYSDFFRAPIRFDEEVAALVFPAGLLERPIAGADPDARRALEGKIRRLKADQPNMLTDELRHYLQTAVTQQRCSAERVARVRLTNRRTLSRRLRAEGTSFRQLASETQFRVAGGLLADTSMSLGQISAVLQFSEPAAFTHAFRRWSGMTPSAWRLNHRLGETEALREDPQPNLPAPKRAH
ncbi:AraC family transcriptional regulator [Methylobacterium sp. P1-11]|nr:AraC family transcriptional regulator [Methylobacterium sp. P1-11]